MVTIIFAEQGFDLDDPGSYIHCNLLKDKYSAQEVQSLRQKAECNRLTVHHLIQTKKIDADIIIHRNHQFVLAVGAVVLFFLVVQLPDMIRSWCKSKS